MKKLNKILFTITVLVLTFAFYGCNKNDNYKQLSYSTDVENVENVSIDVRDREINVTVSEDNQIHIDYFGSEKEFYDISVSENNTLLMTLVDNKVWTDFIGSKPSEKYRKINLRIPNNLLANLSITTTNEKVILNKFSVTDSISISSNGGSIELEQMDAGKTFDLTAKNGNIIGTIIGSYDVYSIDCTIKKGECNLPLQKADGEKILKANCNNGNIQIDFVKA